MKMLELKEEENVAYLYINGEHNEKLQYCAFLSLFFENETTILYPTEQAVSMPFNKYSSNCKVFTYHEFLEDWKISIDGLNRVSKLIIIEDFDLSNRDQEFYLFILEFAKENPDIHILFVTK